MRYSFQPGKGAGCLLLVGALLLSVLLSLAPYPRSLQANDGLTLQLDQPIDGTLAAGEAADYYFIGRELIGQQVSFLVERLSGDLEFFIQVHEAHSSGMVDVSARNLEFNPVMRLDWVTIPPIRHEGRLQLAVSKRQLANDPTTGSYRVTMTTPTSSPPPDAPVSHQHYPVSIDGKVRLARFVSGTLNDTNYSDFWQLDFEAKTVWVAVMVTGDLVPIVKLLTIGSEQSWIEHYRLQGGRGENLYHVYYHIQPIPYWTTGVQITREGGWAGTTSGDYRLLILPQDEDFGLPQLGTWYVVWDAPSAATSACPSDSLLVPDQPLLLLDTGQVELARADQGTLVAPTLELRLTRPDTLMTLYQIETPNEYNRQQSSEDRSYTHSLRFLTATVAYLTRRVQVQGAGCFSVQGGYAVYAFPTDSCSVWRSAAHERLPIFEAPNTQAPIVGEVPFAEGRAVLGPSVTVEGQVWYTLGAQQWVLGASAQVVGRCE